MLDWRLDWGLDWGRDWGLDWGFGWGQLREITNGYVSNLLVRFSQEGYKI